MRRLQQPEDPGGYLAYVLIEDWVHPIGLEMLGHLEDPLDTLQPYLEGPHILQVVEEGDEVVDDVVGFVVVVDQLGGQGLGDVGVDPSYLPADHHGGVLEHLHQYSHQHWIAENELAVVGGACSQVGKGPTDLFHNVSRGVVDVKKEELDQPAVDSIVNDMDSLGGDKVSDDPEQQSDAGLLLHQSERKPTTDIGQNIESYKFLLGILSRYTYHRDELSQVFEGIFSQIISFQELTDPWEKILEEFETESLLVPRHVTEQPAENLHDIYVLNLYYRLQFFKDRGVDDELPEPITVSSDISKAPQHLLHRRQRLYIETIIQHLQRPLLNKLLCLIMIPRAETSQQPTRQLLNPHVLALPGMPQNVRQHPQIQHPLDLVILRVYHNDPGDVQCLLYILALPALDQLPHAAQLFRDVDVVVSELVHLLLDLEICQLGREEVHSTPFIDLLFPLLSADVHCHLLPLLGQRVLGLFLGVEFHGVSDIIRVEFELERWDNSGRVWEMGYGVVLNGLLITIKRLGSFICLFDTLLSQLVLQSPQTVLKSVLVVLHQQHLSQSQSLQPQFHQEHLLLHPLDLQHKHLDVLLFDNQLLLQPQLLSLLNLSPNPFPLHLPQERPRVQPLALLFLPKHILLLPHLPDLLHHHLHLLCLLYLDLAISSLGTQQVLNQQSIIILQLLNKPALRLIILLQPFMLGIETHLLCLLDVPVLLLQLLDLFLHPVDVQAHRLLLLAPGELLLDLLLLQLGEVVAKFHYLELFACHYHLLLMVYLALSGFLGFSLVKLGVVDVHHHLAELLFQGGCHGGLEPFEVGVVEELSIRLAYFSLRVVHRPLPGLIEHDRLLSDSHLLVALQLLLNRLIDLASVLRGLVI